MRGAERLTRTIRSSCRYSIFLCLISATYLEARPEYFETATRYGAQDCSFCHGSTSGGEGLNERGEWLLQYRDRRATTSIDINWLARRDTLVAVKNQLESEVKTLPILTADPKDKERLFDYTTTHGDWPAYGGNVGATKYSPITEINKENIQSLSLAWIWTGSENDGRIAPDSFKGTPLMVQGKLFLRTRYSEVVAIDSLTGDTLWTFDPGNDKTIRPPMFGFTTRGLAYHEGVDGGRVLLSTTDGWLIALDSNNGRPIPAFGQDGRVDLTKGLRREIPRDRTTWSYAPNVCGDTVVIGNQPTDGSHISRSGNWKENVPLGDVRGFDVLTGKQRWIFKTVPQPGEFGNNTWKNKSWEWMGNTNVWSMTSCDQDLGIAYLPVTAPTNHFYGGLRHGDNLFANSVVAVDASTGKRVWHYQTVHHDIWDYDLPAAPIVTDIHINGKIVKALTQVTKTGFLFVFDRVTGAPVWPIREVPVNPSSLEGEKASTTQPQPSWPPPFEMQGIKEADLLSLTPELAQRARALAGKHTIGPLFEPAAPNGTLMLPGIGGGANWGGAAFDPKTETLYVASRRQVTLMLPRKVESQDQGHQWVVRSRFPTIDGLPIVNPPWSSITAYDMRTGIIKWQVPNGKGPKNHPLLASSNFDADLGNPGAAPGLLATPDLIFLGQRIDGESHLVALDRENGKALWNHRLMGNHFSAPPITFTSGGKQFVVLATGAPHETSKLLAFRLP